MYFVSFRLPLLRREDHCLKLSGHNPQVKAATIVIVPAAGLYTTPELGKNQARLAYVLCKDDIQRGLMILEKAIEEYNKTKLKK